MLGLCLTFLSPQPLFAQAANLPKLAKNFGTGQDKVGVMADHAEYELDTGWVNFSGNVAIRCNGSELRSNNVRFNQKTGDAQANGKVVLVGSDGSLWQGEKLNINLKKETGKAQGIDIYSKPFRVIAKAGTITEDKTYLVEDALVTTCTNEIGHSHYQLRANRIRLRPDCDITAWGTVPYLFGVPFFYFPYYWKDLKRHYGLRFEPGYKSSWGPYLLSSYKTPLYLNKPDNIYLDAKTSVDYRMERGFAYGEKFSWELGDSANGLLSAYYLHDDDPPSKVDDPERYRLRFNHSWNASSRDQVLMQGLYVSDDLFMKNFFKDEYNLMTQPDNYLSYTHLADSYSFGAIGRMRLNDFYTQVERLPEGWFNLNSTELGESGVYIENSSTISALNKEFDERNDPMPEAYDVLRFDSKTQLSLPLKFFGFLNVVPRAGYRGTYYSKTLNSIVSSSSAETTSTNEYGEIETFYGTVSSTNDIAADADFRSVFELGTEVSFKSYGLFQDANGSIWRHVVEPYADYSFIPEPNLLPSQIYQFDEIDEIDKANTLRLGLRNRWQIKPVGGVATYERIYLDFYGDINLEPETDEESIEALYAEAKYYPNTWMRLESEAKYDVDLSQVDNASMRLVAWHNIFNTDVEYRYRVDDSSLLLANLTWRMNNRWSVNGYGNYEFETSQVEEIGSWIQRTYDCMALRLYTSVEPGYTLSDGTQEKDDYKVSLLFWLTDFTPEKIREENDR